MRNCEEGWMTTQQRQGSMGHQDEADAKSIPVFKKEKKASRLPLSTFMAIWWIPLSTASGALMLEDAIWKRNGAAGHKDETLNRLFFF
jgi:hypothetical protein